MKIVTAIALLMIFAGIISGIMHFFNYNLTVLRWMNDYPQSQQWVLRGALVIMGLLILVIFRKKINKVKK